MKINRSFNCAIEPARRQLDAPPREPEQRPCTDEFIANGGDYERLPGGGEVVAYGVYAKSEEYPKPVLLPEYVGSMGVIRDRVLSKARREGFTGDFVERMAELGWWIEPLTLASAHPSAPVGVEGLVTEMREAAARSPINNGVLHYWADKLAALAQQPAAEAQAQGGGEVVAVIQRPGWPNPDSAVYFTMEHAACDLPPGTPLYAAPPSAPVGVVSAARSSADFLEAYFKACNTSQPRDWHEAACLAKQWHCRIEEALAQQPAPVAPVRVGDGLGIDADDSADYIEHCAARLDLYGQRVTAAALRAIAEEHRALAKQLAAVDGAMKRDALRYRFIRDHKEPLYLSDDETYPEQLDAQIDAALAAQPAAVDDIAAEEANEQRAIAAYEKHMGVSADDPAYGPDLSQWMAGWNAALAALPGGAE